MWFLIEVRNEKDIGKAEIARIQVSTSAEFCRNWRIGDIFDGTYKEIKHPATPSEETDSAPKGKSLEEIQNEDTLEHRFENLEKLCVEHFFECKKVQTDIDETHLKKSLEERVKSLENAVLDKLYDKVQTSQNNAMLKVLYQTQPEANKWFQEEIAKVKQEMESRTEQLSDEHNELKNAFEAECDHYDGKIKSFKQDISDLQQAFVKYAICKGTEFPEGGMTSPMKEPDIVEQIKAGEKRLLELWGILKNKSSTEEYESLCEHTMKLVSIYTKLPIGGIWLDKDKVTYEVYRKGFKIEFK